MSVIIRRERRQPKRGWRVVALAGLVVLVLAVGVLTLAWQRGGPQPVHRITIDLPLPEKAG